MGRAASRGGGRKARQGFEPIACALGLATAVSLLALACTERATSPSPAPSRDSTTGAPAGWPSYGGDAGGTRYSPLDEITPSNVGSLRPLWTYRFGPSSAARTDAQPKSFQATPILDDGTLYVCSADDRVHAVDAATGERRFVYDPRIDYRGSWSLTCRGVALWRGPAGDRGECTRRVFVGTMDARLIAVDGDTGRACSDFGDGGAVDLLVGLGDVNEAETYPTSPPLVVGDVVVVGALVADNRRVDPPGGPIRAYDVQTGALRWAFDPVAPGRALLPPGAEAEPRFHRGTPNAWSILSADPDRGLVFVPFGAPSPDFFGGMRDGVDYFASSVVALDARTGAVVWRFQTVHHDLWDYDVPAQPTLIDVVKDGRTIPAVAQATKMGHIFLLDRATGEPLYPVEERPVPQTDVPGEWTSATQPFPTFPAPIHPSTFDVAAGLGLTPIDRLLCERAAARLRNEGLFTPPSLEGTIHYPGTAGGVDWGGMAWDPDRELLVMAQSRLAQVNTVVPREAFPDLAQTDRPERLLFQAGTPYFTRSEVFVSAIGTPCSPLPWGTLLAVDLRTGEKAWEVPFGTPRDLLPIPLPPLEIGLPSMGGPIVTAGGVVFIGAAMDDYLRAYSTDTGEKLLEQRLPAGAQATPMTYRLNEGGPQIVVITAGGHATMGTTPGDHLVAFALP